MKTIDFDPSRCDRCVKCEAACREAHAGMSGICLVALTSGAAMSIANCRHCDTPTCQLFCPAGAIQSTGAQGVLAVDTGRCIGCGMCAMGCPEGAIELDSQRGLAFKCDLCGGDPRCVGACPTGALAYTSPGKVVARQRRAHVWAATVSPARMCE
ncbi:MAG TPA: hypothetical protein DDZ84_01775 [Firmicutes bacterium]|nr:hypothetical protein [Bacillota bacterium]